MTQTKTVKKEALHERKYTPLRLSVHVIELMKLICIKRGISRAAVIEQSVRDYAEKMKITNDN